MTTEQLFRRGLTTVPVVACATAWLGALSGRIASSLASHGLLPESMGWMVWPRGPGGFFRGFCAALALCLVVALAVLLARPRWFGVAIIALAVVGALAAPSLPYPGAHALFTSMRPQLGQIAVLPSVAESEETTYYASLPRSLEAMSVNGSVLTDGAGGVFVPQWAALVDDAGGFWFTPGTSPEGRDMWGMICEDPTRLDGDWWVCGMQVEPGGTM
jgi:hypothetical protein